MAASTVASAQTGTSSHVAAAPEVRAVRRRTSPEAGRALEILGHAIEYLADEYIHEGGSLSANNGQVQAIQLLMALNRQIYLECPEIPTVKQRISNFLRALFT